MNWSNKRDELLSATETVISRGVDYWANDRPADGTGEPVTGRLEQREQIIRDRDEYEELYQSSKFGDIVAEKTKKRDLEKMAGAIIYLAAAGYKDHGTQSDLIGDRYDQKSVEVAQFVLDLDTYSYLDQYSKDQIVHLIENEDDDLYQLLNREVAATQEGVQDLNVPESALENDQEVSFLQSVLEERQEKMNRAVQAYVGEKTLPQILEDLEEAILETGKGAQTREEITETIENEIADLEEQLQWALRNQRELFVSEVETMTAELEEELLSSEDFEAELSDLEGELQWAFREHREYLLNELENHSQADAEQLTPEGMIALLHEQRDDIVESLEEYLTQSQSQIEQRLEDLHDKQRALNAAIRDIEESREEVSQKEIETLIEGELAQLTEQRDDLDALIDRFERERARLEAEVESLEDAPTPPEPVSEGSDEIDGTDVIPASVARLYEDDFIARIERSVREAETLALPDGETLTPEEGYWDDGPRSERGSFQGSIVSDLPDDARIRRYPERPWVRFATVESTGLLGQSQETDLVIEGVTATRLSTYAEHGSDWAPTTLSELHGIVGEALDRGLVRDQEDAHHLLVVGSPTGWRERVIEEIESGALFDADVSVCLVDLRTDERYYSREDSLLRNNQWVFSHELSEESVFDAAETIQDEYADDPGCKRVLLEEIVEEHGYAPHVVKRAFDLLEDRGVGKQIETDRGLLLSFDIG